MSLEPLKQAIATFVSRAAEKLRREELLTQVLQVFVSSNRFQAERYSNSSTISLSISTSDTAELLHYALRAAESLYRPDIQFKKAGVILLELTPNTQQQLALWDERNRDSLRDGKAERQQKLMGTLDLINARWGAGTLRFAAAGLKQQPWQTKALRRSPRYTTCWKDIPTAIAQ